MEHICSECDQPMDDDNEGYNLLRYGQPDWQCHTPGCPNNPQTKDEERDTVYNRIYWGTIFALAQEENERRGRR